MTTNVSIDLTASNASQPNTPIGVMVVAAVNPDGSTIGGSGGGSTNVAQVGGTAISLGQKAATASLPVIAATEQLAAMSAFAFTPGSTQVINATTTSANIVLGAAATGALQIANAGTALAFVSIGTVAQTATATSYPVLPGAAVVISGGGATNVAAITLGGTATLYVSRGTGL